MTGQTLAPTKATVQTPSGRISYTEQGAGPVALFVHGVLLNGHLWRHQLADLSDIRRCIAVDLLAHGDTETEPDQDVSVTANAKMIEEFLDVTWSRWLADKIPGTRRRVELQNARIFFPEERCTEFNRELRAHWQSAQREAQ